MTSLYSLGCWAIQIAGKRARFRLRQFYQGGIFPAAE